MPTRSFLLEAPSAAPGPPVQIAPVAYDPMLAGAATVPVPLTRFLGRETEVAEAAAAAAHNRLVTLTGPGGVGKTRLAIAVAETMRPAAAEVVWVSLVALHDPALVVQVVAAALGVREEPGCEVASPLLDRVRAGRLLLVLDNCEHVLAAAAGMVTTLLTASEHLGVLATSRQPLGVGGEVIYPVPLLAVPEPATPAGELRTVSAVGLLVDRARAVQPDFDVTSDNAAALGELCRRLDGVPLAIELAAARLRLLTVEQVNARLDASIRLLSAPGRGPERHRSLQATMDWSYTLLSAAERALFARLAVFAGGFDLDAAEQVAGHEDPYETLDLLSGLVDKSLVLVTEQGRHMRYRLLETVRQYAEDKLTTLERDAVREAHAAYFVALTERAEPELSGGDSRHWLDVLEAERDNLRAALAFSAAGRPPEAALRLSSAAWRFCYLRGHYAEGRSWLQQALRGAAEAPAELRAHALTAAGTLAHLLCEYDDAARDLESALAVFRRVADRAGEAAALQMLGSIARERGDYPRARGLQEESLALSQSLGDDAGVARSLNYLGFLAWLQGDLDLATSLCTTALAMVERLHDREGTAWCLISLGVAEYYRGDHDRAVELLARSLELSRELGYREGIAWCLNELGRLAWHGGDCDRAAVLLRESVDLHRALGDRWRTASVLEDLAALAGGTGDPIRAVRLFVAARAIRDAIGAPVPLVEREGVETADAAARDLLDDVTLASAEQEGRVASLDRLLGETGRSEEPCSAQPPARVTVSAPRTLPLEISALGSGRVERDGQLIGPAEWGYAKPKELLYYLLEFPDRTKEQVGTDLWPWASPGSLRNSFHATLHALRRALGRADRIVFRAGRYAFNRSLSYSYDVERFETARAAAAGLTDEAAISGLRVVVASYGGDYLPDLEGADWIDVRRAGLRRSYESALLSLGRLQIAGPDLLGAIETYQRAIAHDRLLESAHRELVRCYARQGERGLAVRHGRTLVALFRDELGVPPGPETAELLTRLRRGEPV